MVLTIPSSTTAVFNAHATAYEASLRQGLRFSGEGPEYFARRRIAWTRQVLHRLKQPMRQVLDFGCGVGLATALLAKILEPESIFGYDPSERAIARAQHEQGNTKASFYDQAQQLPAGQFDLVYCNGVFHHIDPEDRPAALSIIHRALRPGGCFALWENNPWNPGTRFIMKRVPFDQDAIVLSPITARRMLRNAGLEAVRTDAWFLFPRALHWLRPLETLVHRLPLGGQYLVLARKPSAESRIIS